MAERRPGDTVSLTYRREGEDGERTAEIADISNLDKNNNPLGRDDRQRMFNLGNQLWHSDSSFKPVPALCSLLSGILTGFLAFGFVSRRFEQQADDAIAVLAEVLRAPSFPENELERLRHERLADLAQLRAEPRGLADMYFSQLVYDGTSRFSRMAGGDEQSISRISRNDVVANHARVFRPSTTALIIVGDITSDAALKLAEENFGDWTGSLVETPPVIDHARYDTMRVHVVRKSDAPQSEIRAGHVSVPRVHNDYFPLVIMNAILGGLFSSRLNLNLREAHAYTYGAHSAFDWRRAASPFEMSTAVETGVTANAVRESLKELIRIREEEVSEAELSLAVSYLDGVFPIRFETTAAVAGGLANLEIFRLPSDYFDSYRARVRDVTAKDVLRVAREHLDPARLQVVVVGHADAVVESLADVGAGPVTVYEPADATISESSSVP